MLKQVNVSQKENIHRRAQWIQRFLDKQEGILSTKNLRLLYDYNDDMIIHSIAENTRYKNLTHFGKLTEMLQKDWADIVEKDIRNLVSQLMLKHKTEKHLDKSPYVCEHCDFIGITEEILWNHYNDIHPDKKKWK